MCFEDVMLMLILFNSWGGDVWILWIYISSRYVFFSGEYVIIICIYLGCKVLRWLISINSV